MTTAVSRVARFSVPDEHLGDARQVVSTFVAAIRTNEPGTLHYASYEATERRGDFVHVMTFRDAEAMEFHRGTPWVTAFTERLYPLTRDGVSFEDVTVVASTVGDSGG